MDKAKLEEFKQKFKVYFSYDWDPETFEWKRLSYMLVANFSDYFEVWWNAKRFCYDSYSLILLAKYCNKYFDKWWNPKKFDWFLCGYLAKYCSQHFLVWWRPEKYDWKLHSSYLAQYCYRHFNVWWDPEKFTFTRSSINALFRYCRLYKHVWYPYVCQAKKEHPKLVEVRDAM